MPQRGMSAVARTNIPCYPHAMLAETAHGTDPALDTGPPPASASNFGPSGKIR
jgi:hypothetical protein